MERLISSRFHGRRFEGDGLPLTAVGSLAMLQAVVFDLARQCFFRDNPNRRKLPRRFRDDTTLTLFDIEKGSTTAVLGTDHSRHYGTGDYLYEGCELLNDVLDGIDVEIDGHAARSLTAFYNSLRSGESVDLAVLDHSYHPLSVDVMSRLSGAKIMGTLTTHPIENLSLRGHVYEVDKVKSTFDLELLSGEQVLDVPIPVGNADAVLDAFGQYEAGGLVQVDGEVVSQRNQLLFQAVHGVETLNPLDVPARLEKLRSLEDGWLLDEESIAPPSEGLDWFARTFARHYPSDLTPPYIFPTAQGGINLEWKGRGQRIVFSVDLLSHSGRWLQWDRATDGTVARELDLGSEADWLFAVNQVRSMVAIEQ